MPQYSANPFLLFVIVLIIFLKPRRTRDELRIEKRTGEQQSLSFFDLFFFFFLVFDFSITFFVFVLHRFLFRLIFLFLTAVFLCYVDFDLFFFFFFFFSHRSFCFFLYGSKWEPILKILNPIAGTANLLLLSTIQKRTCS